MSDNNPRIITSAEWREIVELPEVREAWGLADETPEEFANKVYGAKFDFQSGGPGYCGDLYLLQGDALIGELPMVLTRDRGGRLTVDPQDD